MASAQSTLSTAGPGPLAPNCYTYVDRDAFTTGLFHFLDSNQWQTGTIIEFGKLATFAAVRLAYELGYQTDDPNLAIAYLNQYLAIPDRRFYGWRYALKPSAFILEFDQGRADRDQEEEWEKEA